MLRALGLLLIWLLFCIVVFPGGSKWPKLERLMKAVLLSVCEGAAGNLKAVAATCTMWAGTVGLATGQGLCSEGSRNFDVVGLCL